MYTLCIFVYISSPLIFINSFVLHLFIDHPIIDGTLHQIVNKSDSVTLSLIITSNPLSNVTWYENNEKLWTQENITSEMFTHKITSSFRIVSAECIDTKNFTVVTSNGIGEIVEALVELIVNCK